MILLILLAIFLINNTLQIQVLKTFQVCPQSFNVQLIQHISQKQFALLCRNDVDRNQPIQIYNIINQTITQIQKNKTEMLSSFSYNRQVKNFIIGNHNSSVYLYNIENKRIQSFIKIKQNNIIINGAIYLQAQNVLVSIGNNGQICAVNVINKNMFCALAHSFDIYVIHKYNNLIITCGGDKTCKYWSINDNINVKIILLKTILLSKISKVSTIMSSSRRVVVGGTEGYQILPNISSKGSSEQLRKQNMIISSINGPLICGTIVQNWNSLLTIDSMGNFTIIDLSTNSVVNRQHLGEKIVSCQFISMANFITGHNKGLGKLWQV